jgi:tryptophan-rich sensory protein
MDAGDDKFIVIAVAAGAAIVVAILGAVLTDISDWYFSLERPTWQPPEWAFGPAWTTIFALTATAGVIAWTKGPESRPLIAAAFVVNGVLNVAWSWLFFRLRRPDWAFVEVLLFWVSILALIVVCGGVDTLAGWLLTPYLAWVTFAAYLNRVIVRLNRPFA